MIRLTRLNGEAFILNSALIQYVESRPDTYITLTTEERLIVKETPEEVLRRTIDFQRAVRIPARAA